MNCIIIFVLDLIRMLIFIFLDVAYQCSALCESLFRDAYVQQIGSMVLSNRNMDNQVLQYCRSHQ
ncbi:unnamed protein product [Albugo candida]|uniref:Secreted protein n=1 Tax=Albugo candida TaxID=65357 RepID=A0A024GSC8_9STRA|nr:unnamed protein product [Albugo candida]|eukprot:CCI49432.1 unnamed protein product [Albugo candida]